MVSTLKGSVGTMELVAMELKQSGCYLARALSYQVEGEGMRWGLGLCPARWGVGGVKQGNIPHILTWRSWPSPPPQTSTPLISMSRVSLSSRS